MEADQTTEHVKLPISQESQTASEFITEQLALEADAREVLPYKFDKCTSVLGPLRQNIFACLTCSPPPASPAQVYTPAGVCYACSISCHGEHTLVELFSRRDFACDCGTSRLPSTSSCTLKSDPVTGNRGVHSQEPRTGNHYNHNFQNRFCSCGEEYDAETEKGTMFQCLGLGTVESGGCGEDWFHPECLMGLPRDWHKSHDSKEEQSKNNTEEVVRNEENEEAKVPSHPVPTGFPHEDDFEAMVCHKCVESNPWIKKYAGTPGFLAPVFRNTITEATTSMMSTEAPALSVMEAAVPISLKRKASDSDLDAQPSSPLKRVKDEADGKSQAAGSTEPKVPISGLNGAAQITQHDLKPQPKHALLPSSPPTGEFTLFLKPDFREYLCHCPSCYPDLIPHPQLLEDEEIYEPSLSDSSEASQPQQTGSRRSSKGGSIYDRGEAALSNIDRVRAIEGVMVYNHLRDKVKEFLKPYAEDGRVVSAEDIKAYFEKLRGDAEGIKEARDDATDGNDSADNRKEQSGY